MGVLKAGACTSGASCGQQFVLGACLIGTQQLKHAILHTLADSLLCVHLRAILHLMDGEVDLWHLLLLPHRTDGIVEVLLLVVATAFHDGQLCMRTSREGM